MTSKPELTGTEQNIFDAYVTAALEALPGTFDRTEPSNNRAFIEANAYGLIAAQRARDLKTSPFLATGYDLDAIAASMEGGFQRRLDPDGHEDALSGLRLESDHEFRQRILRGEK